jgi:hypothetical protein
MPSPESDTYSDPGARDQADLVIRVEQALLGAVMSDPARQAAVLDLVRPGDMWRPYHGQVLAAMQRLRARGADPGPVAVRVELAADPDLPPRVALDGVLLAVLLEAAPRSGHAPDYAAMVIDHSIRQRLGLAGSRMAQAAEAGELGPAIQVTAQALRETAVCQARWQSLPRHVRQEVPAPAGHRAPQAEEAAWQLRAAREEIARTRQDAQDEVPGDLARRLESIARHVAGAAAVSKVAGRERTPTAGETRPQGQAAEAAGDRFVRDLIAGPGQVTVVRDWLQPGHFARPVHGQLYALIRDMDTAGKPVDPVTIAWEAAKRGIAADAAELEGGMAPAVLGDAREVRRHAVLARISQAGRDLCASAGNPQVLTTALLRDTALRLRSLEREVDPRPGRPDRTDGESRPAARRSGRAVWSPYGPPQPQQASVTAEPA